MLLIWGPYKIHCVYWFSFQVSGYLGTGVEGARDCKRAQNLLGVIEMYSIFVVVVVVQLCALSKLTELSIFNMYSSLCPSYTLLQKPSLIVNLHLKWRLIQKYKAWTKSYELVSIWRSPCLLNYGYRNFEKLF